MRAILTAAAAACCAIATPASAQTLLRDAEIEGMLRDYTDPLLEAAGIRAADVNLYIVGDPTIQAMVSGGQQIFVFTGTITQADTPNQIKGVLAHEIGHIAGGHLTRSSGAQTAAIGSMLATIGLGVLAMAAGAPDAGAVLVSGSSQMGYATMVRHTLVQESAADQAGSNFLEATGQSSEGLLQFFDKLRLSEVMRDRETGSMYGDFLRSHPFSSSRVATLRERVANSAYRGVTDSPEDMHELEMVQAKIFGFMEPPTRVLRRYPASDTSEPARYARAVAYFRNGVLDRALTEIDSLIADHPDNPYFHELKGQMLFESGKAAEAIGPYRESVRLAPGSALLRAGLGQAMVSSGDPALTDEAIEELRTAIAEEPDLGSAWYQLSLAYERKGERSLAQLATAEQSYAMGDYIRAREFASRARDGLDQDQNTRDWRRATDILAASESLAMEQRERMRRSNARSALN